ncbi:MAG TPA: hypothetical protein VJS66_03735 [Burkholderiales bacterium]|nr:hypothetical protein [Burkholderiales bacterium]
MAASSKTSGAADSMRRIAAIVAGLLLAQAAGAEWKVGGHIKYQYTHTEYRADDVSAAVGDETARDHGADLRLKGDGSRGSWDFSVHYELLALQGDTLAARRRMSTFDFPLAGSQSGLPDDRRRLFDLMQDVSNGERRAIVHRLDRLSAGHTGAFHVVRVGRQAVSWGNGLVFHPLDFVNPFSPVAIDKDYKTGDDMLFAQRTLSGGGDWQAIVVPRRDSVTHGIESEEGSYAAKLRQRVGEFDLDLLAARHVGENLVGIGLVRSLGGAVWRLDTSYTNLDAGGSAWSLVTNLDYSWSWFDKNMYGYVEYFRNGVGESDSSNYISPDPALSARIDRGELYTLGRDYLAFGLQVELSPLVNLYTNVIRNLNDGSRYFQLRGIYDWQQNIQFMAGVNLPEGERGEEYGGVPVGVTGFYTAAGRSAFVRAAYFF